MDGYHSNQQYTWFRISTSAEPDRFSHKFTHSDTLQTVCHD